MIGFFLSMAIAAEVPKAEHHVVPTEDGAFIALSNRAGEGPPVLVVHGISSNHRCWDLDEGPSLAVALHQAGFDPWLLDLRGHGLAEFGLDGVRQRRGGSVDDYGRYDVPAALDFVLEKTGEPSAHYVGHSMGGLVLAVALQSRTDLPLGRLVVVGTPMDFSDPDRPTGFLMSAGRLSSSLLGFLPSPFAAHIQGRFGSPFPVDEMLFNDIESPVRERLYEDIVSPLYARELQQLEVLERTGVFWDMEQAQDYSRGLVAIENPTLIIAGRADRIAPPDRVAAFYNGISSHEKQFVLAGRATGFQVDYGHLDLPLGAHAEEEIFPLILDWLVED